MNPDNCKFFTVSDLWMVSEELPRGHTAGAKRVGDRLKSLGDEGARDVEQVNQVSEMRQRGGPIDWSRTKLIRGAIKLDPGNEVATYRMPKSHPP
jgi:hypothetical protein